MNGVKIDFSANDAGFQSTVGKINNSMSGMDRHVQSTSASVKSSFGAMAKAGAALALGFGAIKMAAAAVRGTIDNFSEALDMGGRLNDLSARTGETAGNLLLLERAFQNSGAGADKAGPAINKMQRAIVEAGQGVITYKRAFDGLGVSLEDMKTMTPTEQLALLAKKISGIENPTERSAIAMQLLGRSGGELIPLFMDFGNEMSKAKGELGSLPGIMDKSNASFDAVADKLVVVKGKLTEFAAGVLSNAMPAIEKIVTGLSKIDAAGFGAEWGKKLIDGALRFADILIGAFKAPKAMIEVLGSALKLAAANFGNSFVNALRKAGTFLGELFHTSLPRLILGAYWETLKYVHLKAADLLMKGLKGAADSMGVSLGDTFEVAAMKLHVATVTSSKTLGRIGKEMAGEIGEAWDRAGKSASKDFFGAEAAAERMKSQVDAIAENGKKFRTDMMSGADAAFNMADNLEPAAWQMKDSLITGALAVEKAAKKVKEILTVSQTLIKDAMAAMAKQGVDKGGKLEAKARAAIAEGDINKAGRFIERIQENELNDQLRTGGKIGKRDMRNVRDIAKDLGIDTFKKSNKDLRDEIIKKRQEELRLGKQGKNQEQVAAEKGKPAGPSPIDKLHAVVAQIHGLVAKIEPKLPQHALN